MRRPLGGSGSVKLSQRRAVPPLPLNEFMASTRSLPAPTSLSSNTSSSSIPPLVLIYLYSLFSQTCLCKVNSALAEQA